MLAVRVEGRVFEAAGNDCQVAAPPACVCARVAGCDLRARARACVRVCVCVCVRARVRVSYLPRRISEIMFSRVADSSLPETSHTTWIMGPWLEKEGGVRKGGPRQ